MKLKNKKTGKIVELQVHHIAGKCYESLADVNKDWEDYEEPEEDFWYIDSDCETYGVSRAFNQNDSDDVLFNKSIGNYFETEEEAEKAVEKLKAWKRLKDNGFEIYSWDYEFDRVDKPAQTIILRASAVDSSNTDLDLLFGGEE